MNIEELKRLAEAANKAHGGLPWQVTMARHDGVTHYKIQGHCEPSIAIVRDEYWEDDHHPPVDDYGYIQPDELIYPNQQIQLLFPYMKITQRRRYLHVLNFLTYHFLPPVLF